MRVFLKLLLIGGLLIALLIPLLLLRGLVEERKNRGREVAQEIALASSGMQHWVGPLLLLEAEETHRRTILRNEGGASAAVVQHEEVRQRVHYVVAPQTLAIDSRLSTQERRRGLFGVRLYTDQMRLKAGFQWPETPALEGERLSHRWLDAHLVVGVGDARGIQRMNLRVDGEAREIQPGTLIGYLHEGGHVALGRPDWQAGHRFEVELDAQLQGTQALSWAPLAGEAKVSVQADWPHPGFGGKRLPDSPQIDAQGFRAEWTVSRLSSQFLQALGQCKVGASQCPALNDAMFGVTLVDPVDRYLKTERALKYALLLLVLVFGAVFFVEALRGVNVHPLQYGLTGLALAMFFLLLLSLSEHIGFGPAYGLAAVACVSLIGTYMSAVLGGRQRGVLFALLVAGLYGFLYVLLQSEDYALLAGSLVLFALLAGVMLATRRLDWRQVSLRQ